MMLSAGPKWFLVRQKGISMVTALTILPLAAAGWSLLYLLLGGGLGGAILIFIVLKMIVH